MENLDLQINNAEREVLAFGARVDGALGAGAINADVGNQLLDEARWVHESVNSVTARIAATQAVRDDWQMLQSVSERKSRWLPIERGFRDKVNKMARRDRRFLPFSAVTTVIPSGSANQEEYPDPRASLRTAVAEYNRIVNHEDEDPTIKMLDDAIQSETAKATAALRARPGQGPLILRVTSEAEIQAIARFRDPDNGGPILLTTYPHERNFATLMGAAQFYGFEIRRE